MPYKPLRAFAYAVLLWVSGFIWGSVVFMTAALRSTPPIPYVSRNPAISFPIILLWTVLTLLLGRSYLRAAQDREGGHQARLHVCDRQLRPKPGRARLCFEDRVCLFRFGQRLVCLCEFGCYSLAYRPHFGNFAF